MDEKLKEIGNRIHDARKAKGLSQNELAEMVDISTPYLSDIEHGKKNFSISVLISIMESLQISGDWLLRAQIPSTNSIQYQEITELLSDCSATEIQSLMRILQETKSLIRKK